MTTLDAEFVGEAHVVHDAAEAQIDVHWCDPDATGAATFTVDLIPALAGSAWCEGGWVEARIDSFAPLCAAAGVARPTCPHRIAMPAGWKTVRGGRPADVALRFEAVPESGGDFRSPVRDALSHLWHAVTALGDAQATDSIGTSNKNGPCALDGADLEGLCREAGPWTTHRRSEDAVAVDLEVPCGSIQAVLGASAQAVTVVAVPAPMGFPWPAATSVCRHAVTTYLDVCAEAFRLVRVADVEDAVGFVVRLAPRPSPAALHGALCACSVSATACSPQVRALACDEALARAYRNRSSSVGAVRGQGARGRHQTPSPA